MCPFGLSKSLSDLSCFTLQPVGLNDSLAFLNKFWTDLYWNRKLALSSLVAGNTLKSFQSGFESKTSFGSGHEANEKVLNSGGEALRRVGLFVPGFGVEVFSSGSSGVKSSLSSPGTTLQDDRRPKDAYVFDVKGMQRTCVASSKTRRILVIDLQIHELCYYMPVLCSELSHERGYLRLRPSTAIKSVLS